MSLKALQERQTQLVLQRSQGKDIIEQTERELGAVNLAIQQINLYIEEQAKEVEAKTSEDVLAAVLPFPTHDEVKDEDQSVDVAEEVVHKEVVDVAADDPQELEELPRLGRSESDNDDNNNRTA